MRYILLSAAMAALIIPSVSMAHVRPNEVTTTSLAQSHKVLSVKIPKDMINSELSILNTFEIASTLEGSIEYDCVCGGGAGGAISSSGGMGMGTGSMGVGSMGSGGMGMGNMGNGEGGGGSSATGSSAKEIGKIAGKVIGSRFGGKAGKVVGGVVGGVIGEEIVERGGKEEGKPFHRKGSKFH